MVSLRRRKLLGHGTGIVPSDIVLPRNDENVTTSDRPSQHFKSTSVHPEPLVDLNQSKEIKISNLHLGSSNLSGTSLSKEVQNQRFPGEKEIQGERSDIPVVEGIQGENQKGDVIAEGVTGEKQVQENQATPMEIETDISLFQRMGTLLSQFEDLSRNLCNCLKKGISTDILAVEEKRKLQLGLQELKEQTALQEKKSQELEVKKIKERRIEEELKKENSSLEAKVKTLKMEKELIGKTDGLLKDQLVALQNSIDNQSQSTIFLSKELHVRKGKLATAKRKMELMQREQDDLKVETKRAFNNAIYTGNLYRALYLEISEETGTAPIAEFPKPLPEGKMYVVEEN